MKKIIQRFTCDLCNESAESPMLQIGINGMIDREFIDKHVCDSCLRKIVAAWKRLGSVEHEKRRLT